MFIIIVFLLDSYMPSGLLFFVLALLISILTPLFLTHGRVFGKTLVHEFLIS